MTESGPGDGWTPDCGWCRSCRKPECPGCDGCHCHDEVVMAAAARVIALSRPLLERLAER